MRNIVFLILLFPILCFAQWGTWTQWGGGLIDNTSPPAPLVTLTRNDADSTNITIDFRGTTEIDTIFVRSSSFAYPTSKTDGDSVFTGTDTTLANSLVAAHGLSTLGTHYIRCFVQDTIPNIGYGSASLAVDEWVQNAPTTITADSNNVNSIDVLATGYDPDTDSTFAFATSASCVPNKDSVGIDSISCVDSLESWTFAHGFTTGDATLHIYFGVQDLDANLVWDSLDYYLPAFPQAGDTSAPNITGTFTVKFDSVYSFRLQGNVKTDSTDAQIYRIELKTHASDDYSLVYNLTSLPADTILAITPTLSMKDSIFARISILDSIPNQSAFVYDTVVTSPIFLYLTTNVGTDSTSHVWVHRNTQDSTKADSFRIAFEDCQLSGDSILVPINTPNDSTAAFYAGRNFFQGILGLISNWLEYP